MTEYYLSCPKGLEQLLQWEMETIGVTPTRHTVGGVWGEATQEQAYRLCLWSRLANKILLPLAHKEMQSADDLYDIVKAIPWEDHINPAGKLLVDFSGTNRTIRHSQFGALRVKDAIVDRCRETLGARPSIDKDHPDLLVNARLHKGRVTIAIDLVGESLHRRAYRLKQGAAPLKENLAAALLYRAGWMSYLEEECALLDPMCGSATLLIEGAMMAADIAPGMKRQSFGFERWLNHRNDLWLTLREEAIERREVGLAKPLPEIRGYDEDRRVLDAAEFNIGMAGLSEWVRVIHKPVAEFKKPTHRPLSKGLILTNPPYGERLGEEEALKGLYRSLGDQCRASFQGWQAGIFTGNPDLGKHMGLRAQKKYKFYNGKIPSELLLIDIAEDSFVNAPPPDTSEKLSEGAQMVANRLQKNRKSLTKWQRANGVEAFRLYDADMPEYAAAIDLYGEHVHIQEYQAPKSVDEQKAQQRLADIEQAVRHVLQPDREKISVKQRRRNRGKQQYERLGGDGGDVFTVREGQGQFRINLWDYLDTGLFLDHRPLRLKIAESAKGKKFLNLFCYTASASVHAALGGATETVNVDLSKTYLEWAQQNFEANHISLSRHRFIHKDCLQWLQECREGFDVIMLDPPTFSNSKRMEGVLDIQRDHVTLVKRCMDLLTPTGVLYFSNNQRTFKLDESALDAYEIHNITADTIDADFKRNSKIHHCWEISHRL
ncbi:bifunctional 23S rRNA (guanine(2069)-N(7))-methyltransferase RlmK/23S rRNA (guanine(2445)-N(2))-methyltransferase RlmL [Marinibactrum halimedae]|uniref:Ribosomal RNA large subunit methyltransferase K/L n=1 Tax=Marinibactrum halimedae TaxID=1444977 RepID=A0AA37T5J0_9GAMM|nr:bifunctional 23S rRNA (guanine(2069)-N(7))-methyltransferase RlmK/23S rRNA (guanine(2445)-N(2))-methyltransferase RlmL [Marinibactrum halimedae]MCD9459242.1 bifunctional 23S rRNA (guanine(2069)-N(7))-methyltransferase RlmK/23S rRNA (guanine(2445)-N(2))-methyltransferase RlmL [Marinibactrum halimedae]GLS27315.1 ribosomal RNA large subunit methyltransferase K/L [Marinibactrum halimedae]